jgi:hypothetical protein
MWRRFLQVFPAVSGIFGVVGWITVPDDAALWPETLRPLIMAVDRDTAVIALLCASSAGFAWTIVGPWIAEKLRHRRRPPLEIGFTEPGKGKAFENRGNFANVYMADSNEKGMVDAILLRRLCFLVRNNTNKTIDQVSVSVRRFMAPETRPGMTFRPVNWPLQIYGTDTVLASIPPRADVPFTLLEVAEKLGASGPGMATALMTDRQAVEILRTRLRPDAFIGGINQDFKIVCMDGLEVGVAVHGRDAPPTYGWFRMDLMDGFKVTFRKAASVD